MRYQKGWYLEIEQIEIITDDLPTQTPYLRNMIA